MSERYSTGYERESGKAQKKKWKKKHEKFNRKRGIVHWMRYPERAY